MNENQTAEQIAWDAPGSVQMSLVPMTGGLLQIRVEDGAVTVTGRNCRLTQGDSAKAPKDVGATYLAEVQLTIPLCRCFITWKAVAAPGQV